MKKLLKTATIKMYKKIDMGEIPYKNFRHFPDTIKILKGVYY